MTRGGPLVFTGQTIRNRIFRAECQTSGQEEFSRDSSVRSRHGREGCGAQGEPLLATSFRVEVHVRYWMKGLVVLHGYNNIYSSCRKQMRCKGIESGKESKSVEMGLPFRWGRGNAPRSSSSSGRRSGAPSSTTRGSTGDPDPRSGPRWWWFRRSFARCPSSTRRWRRFGG